MKYKRKWSTNLISWISASKSQSRHTSIWGIDIREFVDPYNLYCSGWKPGSRCRTRHLHQTWSLLYGHRRLQEVILHMFLPLFLLPHEQMDWKKGQTECEGGKRWSLAFCSLLRSKGRLQARRRRSVRHLPGVQPNSSNDMGPRTLGCLYLEPKYDGTGSLIHEIG